MCHEEKGSTCTDALLTSDVPCTLDSGAINPLAGRCASTARFELIGGVEALQIVSETVRVGDGTCGETHRAQLNLAHLQCTFRLCAFATLGGLGFGLAIVVGV